jgi:hypothetical protein
MAESRWRTLYQAAVIEIDPEKVGARAIAAELAINSHIFADYQHISRDERSAMEHALSALGVLTLEEGQSMTKVAAYNTNSIEYIPKHRDVFHDHDDCPDGKKIKPEHRQSGTAGKHRCDECINLG